MQNELLVLLGKDVSNHKRFRTLIKEHTLRKETKNLLDNIDLYYKNHPEELRVNWEAFESWFLTVRAAHLSTSESILYKTLFDRIRKLDVEESVVMEEILEHFIKLDYVGRIQERVARIISDEKIELDTVGELIEEYQSEVGRALDKSKTFVTTDVTKLVGTVTEPGFEWAQEFLNRAAGPLRRGNLVIFGARPETGKTTFAASNVAHWAQQPIHPERPIIWVNNEERSDEVMMRIVQAAFRATSWEIEEDPETYNERFNSIIGPNRILLLAQDSGFNSVKSLESLFDEYKPCAIIFDQLDKVSGFENDKREDIRLGNLYKWARECAVKYGPCMALSQMSESADLDKYPHYSKLRGSKTDKGAEADLVIGMGLDDYTSMIRGFFLSKNKLHGGPKTDRSKRHGYFDATIVPERAYFEEPR